MSISKVLVIAVVACFFSVLLSQHRPEFSLVIKLASVVCIIAVVFSSAAEISEDVMDFADGLKINNEYILLLIKALIIAVACHIVSCICVDTGNKAIASAVELAGRISIILLALPMLKALSQIARELIK
ncbi:MAG: SpoIIIAC/SpoIIIAD family protein [Acutalibacteraceae bacterium]|nr:SpoIIIAC/SpoIIIAD family protein [Acutalibacteraceae bacterium]